MKMQWYFEKYKPESTRQDPDPGSEKHFKDAPESDSLIREFIQNSLDAASPAAQGPVKALVAAKKLKKRAVEAVLSGLKPHLQACGVIINEAQDLDFVVLEDFNTKGLEGEHEKKFFRADNITGKTEGGGSHGIGKAVFPAASQIKTFLGYSIFEGGRTFQGRSVLKTHEINGEEFRPYGNLDIVKENESLKDFDPPAGVWNWLSALYYKRLLNESRKIGELRRMFVSLRGARYPYRHLLKAPYDICRFYTAQEGGLKSIQFILMDRAGANGELYRRIAENQDIIRNPVFIKTARRFFYDGENKSIKKNMRIADSVQRLIKIWKQHERSFDMYRMPYKAVIKKLLAENEDLSQRARQ